MPFLRQMIPNWVKPYGREAILKCRQVTWSVRGLPDFIIIGAQRSGTTSMFSYLSQHPQLLPSYIKEVHYFDGGLNPRVDNFEKGQPWYRAHFPIRHRTRISYKMFEASPFYIFNPLVPQRIADLVPEVKIIALLRNPTERAISQYFHEKRKDRESLSIYEALQIEERRLKSVIKEEDYKNEVFIYYSYKSRGLYKEQIERYLKFFSREQILVMSSEEFFAEPDMCLRRVFEFIGVDPEYTVRDLKPRNVAHNRSKVSPDVYEYLDSFFKPYNQELYEFIGKDYGWNA